ncbi:MAG TPA: 1-deoxy-D-xylulose-5-phosphate reductoisomerase [Candidatus Coprocola pullicola]|mgnify:FL=1|nr:1-deoxy-D-xylulose-5-phosphate reductoisomerase [Candidatus Coprocola pullicola]
MKTISILGSTGSIGTQTLEVVKNLGSIRVAGLTGNENVKLMEKQYYAYRPSKIAMMNMGRALQLRERLAGEPVSVLWGMEGIIEVATMKEVDMVITSVVGNVGLEPTFEAIRHGKDIALANKETLVSAGKLVMDEIKKKKVTLYPIDSEHSAIFQCLQGNEHNAVRRIFLTASGGPFRGKTKQQLENVTVEDALKHPNWDMGKKITIDSATLMNKGLEVMEARWLFDVSPENIEVLVHPQSIIHSAVEYEDGAIIAQMGEPDMKIPIQYALTYPDRIKNSYPKIDFSQRSMMTFEKPDLETFCCLSLAFKALKIGGTMPAVLNSANEVAVRKFIEKKIGFLDIARLIEKTMNAYTVKENYTLEDLLAADRWARNFAENSM